MRKQKFYAILFILLFVCIILSRSQSFVSAFSQKDDKKPYIVVYSNSVDNAEEKTKKIESEHLIKHKHIYNRVLKGFSTDLTEEEVEKIRKDKDVRYVVEDGEVFIDVPKSEAKPGGRRTPTPTQTPTSTLTPTKTPSPTLTRTPTPTKSPIPSPTKTPSFTPTPTRQPIEIHVDSPNGGEILTQGEIYRIKWTSSPVINMVSIAYVKESGTMNWVVYSYANTGYYDWIVDLNSSQNTKFKIKITGYYTGYGSDTDTSDDYVFYYALAPTPTFTPTNTPTPTLTPTPTQPIQSVPSGVRRIGGSRQVQTNYSVAVIDTGIDYDHPDLLGLVIGGTNCVDNSVNTDDDSGHGTHVSGIITALDNNIGVVGVVPGIKLVPVKVFNSLGRGTWSQLICGIEYVTLHAQEYNIKVANMSLGGTGTSDNNCGLTNNDPVHEAICASTQAGITYVAAAGNSNRNTAEFIPASYDDTLITVSALADSDGLPGGLGIPTYIGADDTFANFSNYGSSIDLGAPGVNILSSLPNNAYEEKSGTSMAAPHVSAAVLFYHTNHPNYTWNQIKDALIENAEKLGNGHTDPSGNHPEPVLILE